MADNVNITPGAGAVVATDECVIGGNTVQVQRVKTTWGVDGTANDVSATNPFPTTVYIWDPVGSAFTIAGATTADGVSGASLPLVSKGLFNETTVDRQRGNTQGTLLASLARTSNTQSPDTINYNARGVQLIVNLTAFTTAASIVVNIEGKGALGNYYALTAAPTAITATGVYVYEVYPGVGAASGGVTARTSGVVPRVFRANITHNNGNSHTYAVTYQLIV